MIGILGCLQEMDASLVYNILKAFLEHQQELAMAHGEMRKFTLKNAAVDSPIPFHPGAVKYFKEKGIEVK